jgi:pimeloyl-ACP methyl ester carboxylesterase
MDDYARDVLALMDHLHLDAAVVGGLSMGGYLVFALQRLAPKRLRGLVLADTRPEADGEQARALRVQTLERLDREGPSGVAEAMLPKLLGRSSREKKPDLVAWVREVAAGQPAEGIRRAVLSLKARPDSTPTLGEIRVPTLIVVGEEDEITGPDLAQQMHGQVAGSELVLVPGAGHLANLEHPGAFNAALARFLSTRFP